MASVLAKTIIYTVKTMRLSPSVAFYSTFLAYWL
jgi:hypothetical protein